MVISIGALSAFAPLSIDMYLPALPSLSRDLGGTASSIQLTLTACLLGLAFGQVIAGPLSDARGRKPPLLAGLFIYTLASLLCALAPSVSTLIVLRLMQGLAGAAGIVIARAMVRDLYSGSAAARFFALTMLVNGLAPILAPIIGGQLLPFTSWRGVFLVLGGIGGALFVTSLWLRETLPPARRRRGGIPAMLGTFRLLLTDLSFMGYALSGGLAFAAMFSYISASPFVLEDIFGLSPQVFSLVFAANALGIVVASQCSARLVDRVGPRALLALGLSVSAVGGLLLLVVVALGIGLVGVLPGYFLVVASIGLILPNAAALALADHPHAAGSASALLGVLQFVVGAAVAPLAGIGGTSTALPMAIVIAVLATAGATTFALMTRRPALSA